MSHSDGVTFIAQYSHKETIRGINKTVPIEPCKYGTTSVGKNLMVGNHGTWGPQEFWQHELFQQNTAAMKIHRKKRNAFGQVLNGCSFIFEQTSVANICQRM
jgi:hypothetical protein